MDLKQQASSVDNFNSINTLKLQESPYPAASLNKIESQPGENTDDSFSTSQNGIKKNIFTSKHFLKPI